MDDLDRPAIHSSGRVDVVHGDVHAVVDRELEGGEDARETVRSADDDRLAARLVRGRFRRLGAAAADGERGQGRNEKQHERRVISPPGREG